jgi:hypothetical protein
LRRERSLSEYLRLPRPFLKLDLLTYNLLNFYLHLVNPLSPLNSSLFVPFRPYISSKPRFVEKIKPTAEEIETRQKWKAERNEAKAKGLPPPPKPVLAYELGGKVPVEKKSAPKKDGAKKDKAKTGAKGKGGKGDKKKKGSKKAEEEGSKELLPEV